MMKILVVDDEKLVVKGIKFNLEHDGYEVVTAFDGASAVALTSSEKPDLVILDLMMPKLDGLEACMQIRAFSNVPIIMLTARSTDMDKLMGFECGADDYVTKPFNILERKPASVPSSAVPVLNGAPLSRRASSCGAGTSFWTWPPAAPCGTGCR